MGGGNPLRGCAAMTDTSNDTGGNDHRILSRGNRVIRCDQNRAEVRNSAKLRHIAVPDSASRPGTKATINSPPQMYTG
jgi:hypothetical protein